MVITTIKNAHPVVGVDIAVTCRAHFSSSPLAHPVSLFFFWKVIYVTFASNLKPNNRGETFHKSIGLLF